MLFVPPMRAQTLAHPGLRGNGIAPQAWWKHASFVRMGADTTFAGAAHILDAMSEAGVDSMILPDLQPAADSSLPFAPRFGSQDDLDALLREASARRMHVLVGMPVTRLSAGGDEVRFWMSRGVAGFDAGSVTTGDLSVLRGVRSAMAKFPGERILLAHTTDVPQRAAGAQRDPITLHLASLSEVNGGQATAMDVTDLSSIPLPSVATALVFNESLLKQEADRSRIHNLLAARARSRGHTGR